MGDLGGHFLPTMRDHRRREVGQLQAAPREERGQGRAQKACATTDFEHWAFYYISSALGGACGQSGGPNALLIGVAVVRRGAAGEILDDARFETCFRHTGRISRQARSTRSQHARACVRGSAWPASATMASALLGSRLAQFLGPLHGCHAVAAAVQNEHLCCDRYGG